MITLTSVDHVSAPPEKVWHFLTHLHEGDNYQKWHPAEHIIWQLQAGDPETVGSTYYFAETLGGKKLASGFRLDKAVRSKYLEYGATGLLRPLHIVSATFALKEINMAKTELVAKVHIGYTMPIVGPFVDWIARKSYDMAAIQKHMAEEGYYLNGVLTTKEG